MVSSAALQSSSAPSPSARTIEQVVKALLDFLGHGNISAPCWFLGMEEGADENALALEANVRTRLAHFEPAMCLHESVRLLGSPITATRRPNTPTWPWMAKIIRGLVLGASDWRDPNLAREYITTSLGKKNAHCFMAELMPLPRKRYGAWPPCYAAWWPTSQAYERAVMPARVALLQRMIQEHRPKWVIAYGKTHHSAYKSVFPDASWIDHGRLSLGRSPRTETSIALVPFLGIGAFGERDAEELLGALR
jgi:hypothetical protein